MNYTAPDGGENDVNISISGHCTEHFAEGISVRTFCGVDAGFEHYFVITAPINGSFQEQLETIKIRYEAAQAALNLKPETAIFRRIFLSDILNQAQAVQESALFADNGNNPVAVSIVQQQPLPNAKICLMAYHVEADDVLTKQRLSPQHVIVEKNGARHLWSTGIVAAAHNSQMTSTQQTQKIFGNLYDAIDRQGGALREHCVRTWLYLKDVDVFYQDMVDSRRELFGQYGLTQDTHYLASTGIEGANASQYDVVALDAYTALDLAAPQISYLNDFDLLCPTINYAVTFERGTRIAFADRRHYYISGTASIDNAGKVVYPGNVLRQTERALDNVEALLRSGDACLKDMMYLLVYLRDPTDYSVVELYLRQRLPNVPAVIVHGAVCRPEWLVEIEGIAITHNDDATLASF
jgi:enamine deaminase RidA (YjgF/YER057c/UK114 family)